MRRSSFWILGLLLGCTPGAGPAEARRPEKTSLITPRETPSSPLALDPLQPFNRTPSIGSPLSPSLQGPLRLEAFDPGGHWLSYCDRDDELYLALLSEAPQSGSPPAAPGFRSWEPKPQRRLEELVAWSRDGRYLLERTGSTIRLLDIERMQEQDLTFLEPDLDADQLLSHRSFAFAEDSSLLAVLSRPNEEGRTQFLSVLALPLVPEALPEIQRVELVEQAWRVSAQGRAFVLDAASERKPRGWPVPARAGRLRRCAREAGAFAAYPQLSEPDAAWRRRVSRVALPPLRVAGESKSPLLASLTAQAAPGFVMQIGEAWVRREGNGRLLLVEGRTQRQIASERCGGRIHHVDPIRKLFIVSCEEYRPLKTLSSIRAPRGRQKAPPPRYRFPLYLVGSSTVHDLGVEAFRVGFDQDPSPTAEAARFAIVGEGEHTLIVDLELRRSTALGAGVRLLAASETEALLRSGKELLRFEPKSASLTSWGTSDPLVTVFHAPSAVALGSRLYRLGRSPISLPAPPSALASSGALYFAPASPDAPPFGIIWTPVPEALGSPSAKP